MRVNNKQAIEINNVAEAMADTLISPALAYVLIALRDTTALIAPVLQRMNKPSVRFREYQIGAEEIAIRYLTDDRKRPDGSYNLSATEQAEMTKELETYKEDFEDVVVEYEQQQEAVQAFLVKDSGLELPMMRLSMFPPNVTVGIISALNPVIVPVELPTAPTKDPAPEDVGEAHTAVPAESDADPAEIA